MKYYEYGVRTYESVNFLGKFGDKPNEFWRKINDDISRLGIQGWEVYQVIEKNNITHFLLRKEIVEKEAKNMYMAKEEDTYPLGFVDHIRK